MTVCLRPIPASQSALWFREGRNAERKVDYVRCLCGKPDCRDAEVKED